MLSRRSVDRGLMEQEFQRATIGNRNEVAGRYADVALVQAAIEAYDARLAVEQKQFFASAVRGRPQVRSEVGLTAELRYRGHSYSPRTYRLGPQRYRVAINGVRIDAQIERLDRCDGWLTVFGRRFRVVSRVEGLSYRIEVDGVSHQIDRDDGGVVHAPAPAVVVSILVKPGDTVAVGDRLAVLEAMKMETQIVAPFAGKVRQVMAIPNVQVDTGAPLLQIDPIALRRNLRFLVENRRMVTLVDSPRFGAVAMVEIGATNVGRIRQTFIPGRNVAKGEEKGLFAFGGSCVISVFERGRIRFDADLLEQSARHVETYAKMGERLGAAT